MDIFVICVSCVSDILSVPRSLVVTCWERTDLLDLLYVMLSCVFVTFAYGALGRLWHLIVSIPDLYLLSYFESVTCLATDASLTADPGVQSLILARSHTLVVIDHEIISTVILLKSAESFKKGCESMCMKYWLTACSSLPRKKCG